MSLSGCLIILSTIAAEAVVGFWFFALALAGTANHWRFASEALLLEMPLLFAGGLACLVRSATSLRMATIVGVLLLVIDVWLVMSAQWTATLVSDIEGVLTLMLPSLVVLGGALLMRRGPAR